MDNKDILEKSTEVAKEVIKDSENSKDYHTGLMLEKVFVSVFKKMPLEHKEQFRTLMNKMIAEDKKVLRIIQHEKQKSTVK
jgi:hypothetical protein